MEKVDQGLQAVTVEPQQGPKAQKPWDNVSPEEQGEAAAAVINIAKVVAAQRDTLIGKLQIVDEVVLGHYGAPPEVGTAARKAVINKALGK